MAVVGRTSLYQVTLFFRNNQHVLPPGFMKIRYYGFLHPSSHIPLELAVTLLEAWSGVLSKSLQLDTDQNSGPFCPECAGPVRLLYFLPPRTIVPKTAGFS